MPSTSTRLIEPHAQAAADCLKLLSDLETSLKRSPLLDRLGLSIDSLRVPLRVTVCDRSPDAARRNRESLRFLEDIPEDVSESLDNLKLQMAVISGDPGSGKSEWLKYRAREIARLQRGRLERQEIGLDDVVLPIFARLPRVAAALDDRAALRELAKASGWLTGPAPPTTLEFAALAILSAAIGEGFPRRLAALAWKWLRGCGSPDRLVFFLDAWDEVRPGTIALGRGDRREETRQALYAFAEQAPAQIFATSRIVGYEGGLLPVKSDYGPRRQLQIVPFQPKDTETLVHSFFSQPGIAQPADGRELAHELRSRPAVREMGRNPLLCTLLCAAFSHPNGNEPPGLPARRSQVYERLLKGLLGDWVALGREQSPNGIVVAKEVLLREIAGHFFPSEDLLAGQLNDLLADNRSTFDSTGDLKRWLDNQGHDILAELQQDGVLAPSAADGYRFLHPTFMQYLAADAIAARPDWRDIASKCLYDPLWQETLRLLGGCFPEGEESRAQEWFSALLSSNEEDLICRPLELAVHAAAEAPAGCIPAGKRAALAQLMVDLTVQDPSWFSHAKTRQLIALLGSESLPLLLPVLRDPDPNVRRRAVAVLGEIGAERGVEALIDALSDEDSDVRMDAAKALGQIGSDRAVDALIAALSDEDWRVLMTAAYAMGRIGSDGVMNGLISALSHKRPYARACAAETLGQIGSDSVVGALIGALHDDGKYVRANAAEAIGRIGSDGEVNVLISALRDEDEYVRRRAAEALGRIGSERAVEILIAALCDGDATGRARAAEALGRIGSDRAVAALIDALRDDVPNVRAKAAEALGPIGSDSAVDALIAALHDRDRSVQHRAAESLGHIGSGRADDALIAALRDKDRTARYELEFPLCQIGSDRGVDALIGALSDEDPFIREMAASLLGEIRSDRAVDDLITVLNDEDMSVRWDATYALGEIRSDRAVNALITVLNDTVEGVQAGAVHALGQIGSDRGMDALIAALCDKTRAVRREAAEALGRIGCQRAVNALIVSLPDEDPEVRKGSALALDQIGALQRIPIPPGDAGPQLKADLDRLSSALAKLAR